MSDAKFTQQANGHPWLVPLLVHWFLHDADLPLQLALPCSNVPAVCHNAVLLLQHHSVLCILG